MKSLRSNSITKFLLAFSLVVLLLYTTLFSTSLSQGQASNKNLAFAENETNMGYAQISTSAKHSLAIDENGQIWSWGDNGAGQLGLGHWGWEIWSEGTTPICIADYFVEFEDMQFKQVVAGSAASYALTVDGEIWSWGHTTEGELGIGDTADAHNSPQRLVDWVPDLAGVKFKKIAANGFRFALALDEDGNVYTCGINDFGQLGQGSLGREGSFATFTKIESLAGKNIVDIATGEIHALALTDDGKVYSWGSNTFGQLGLNHDYSEIPLKTTPTLISFFGSYDITVDMVSAGWYTNFARAIDGETYSWGDNQWGQLGFGSSDDNNAQPDWASDHLPSYYPQNSFKALQVNQHALAINQNDELIAFGRNTSGQLGIHAIESFRHATPINLSELGHAPNLSFDQVAVTHSNSLALAKNGEVYSWGYSEFGNLGLGFRSDMADEEENLEFAKPTYVGSLLNPKITGVTALADSSFTLTEGDVNVPVNITEINVSFDTIMATGSDRITDSSMKGDAILRIKNKDGGGNILKTNSNSDLQTQATSSVKHTWSNDAKTLTLEPNTTLQYDTTYILRLTAYNKSQFGGDVSIDLKFTTEPDPNAPTDNGGDDGAGNGNGTDNSNGENGSNGGNANNSGNGSGSSNNNGNTASGNNGIVDNNSNNSTNGGNGNNGATNTNGNGVGARTARPNENGTTEPTDEPNNTDPATITDNQTPLSNGQTDSNWSLLSLILGIASVIISLMFMLIRRRKDEEKYTDAEHKNRSVLKLTAVLLGIIPIVLFLVLDDLTASMVFVNRYTVLVAIGFIIHIVIATVAKVRSDKDEEEQYSI
jgi:alpha-tubulin suppressor-like RCC1 family protein/uncharacterized Tic20 family protein